MKRAVLLSVVGSCLMVSCGKESTPTPPSPAPTANRVSIADSAPASDAPSAPTGTAPTPAASDAPAHDFAADAARLTKGLKDYFASKGKLPVNLDEIKAAGFIPAIPEPPPGKRWDFDRKKVEVIASGYEVGF